MNKGQKYALIIGGTLALISSMPLVFGKSKILAVAEKYLGILSNNEKTKFFDKNFEIKIRELGNWRPGLDYCASFVRLVYLEALSGQAKELAKKMISRSTQLSWKNFKNNPNSYFKVSKKPKQGSIALWQWTNKPTHGHAEIVKKASTDYFIAISANSKRNGKRGIFLRKRKYAFNSKPFKLLGFINLVND